MAKKKFERKRFLSFITGISLAGFGWRTMIKIFDGSHSNRDFRHVVSHVPKNSKDNGETSSIVVMKEPRSVVRRVSID